MFVESMPGSLISRTCHGDRETRAPMLPARIHRRRSARAVLVGLLLLLVAGFWQPVVTVQTAPPGRSDPEMFETVVRRMVAGATYYPAMGEALRAGNYPVRSTFNWRLPTLYAAFAHGQWVTHMGLLALIVTVLLFTIELTDRLPLGACIPIIALEIGTLIFLLTPLGRMFTEAWAGALLALGVLAYARRWHVTGAVLVLASLFVRELVAPFALVCGLLAITGRRWREAAVWTLGGVGFLAYYACHAYLVQIQILPSDMAYTPSWVQLGGLQFLLSTIRSGSWFPLGPPWIVAFACTLVVASLWSPAPRHLKACVVTYLAFFAIVGQPVNRYWGLLVAPTWAMGIGYGLLGIRQLWKSAAGVS